MRQTSIPDDFEQKNVRTIKSMQSGRLPQPRIDLPANVEVF
jgi:hypothetical protein